MKANVFLNSEIFGSDCTPKAALSEIDTMGLVFDGDNPSEPETYVETEDIVGEPDQYDPNLDLFNPQFGRLCNMLVGRNRKEQLEVYFQGIDAMRKQLDKATYKEQVYAITTFGVDLDRAMMATNTWNEGWDSFERLSKEFDAAERQVKRLEAIAAEVAASQEYAKAYWTHMEKARDNERVSA